MTYGVDQCRCCGVPIKSSRSTALEEYTNVMRKPTMPEAEWRRLGLLAPPTRYQLAMPQTGCCQPCGEKLIRRRTRPFRRMAKVALAAVVAFTIIWMVALYITH
jgi:predicted nucleic acid-binding Zn ribbon protein